MFLCYMRRPVAFALLVSPHVWSGRNADRRRSGVRHLVALRRAICCHEPPSVPYRRDGLTGAAGADRKQLAFARVISGCTGQRVMPG